MKSIPTDLPIMPLLSPACVAAVWTEIHEYAPGADFFQRVEFL